MIAVAATFDSPSDNRCTLEEVAERRKFKYCLHLICLAEDSETLK